MKFETAKPPVAVDRRGWRRHFHPTMAELEQALRFVEVEARHWRWKNLEALQDFFGSKIREQILASVGVDIAELCTLRSIDLPLESHGQAGTEDQRARIGRNDRPSRCRSRGALALGPRPTALSDGGGL